MQRQTEVEGSATMAKRNELGTVVAQLYRDKRWAEAMAVLNPVADSSDDLDSGWAAVWLSGVVYAENPAETARALRHIEFALRRLHSDPSLRVMALLQGAMYALYIDDLALSCQYVKEAFGLFRSNPGELAKWEGNIRYQDAVACANIAEQQMDEDAASASEFYGKALRQALMSAEWFDRFAGAWDENDRQCRIIHARTLAADIMWATGDREGAMAIIKPIRTKLETTEKTAACQYWSGRAAMFDGHHTEAARHFRAALDKVIRNRIPDHYLTRRIKHALAESLRSIGETAEAVVIIDGLLSEAACVENVPLILDLQILREKLVGRDANDSV